MNEGGMGTGRNTLVERREGDDGDIFSIDSGKLSEEEESPLIALTIPSNASCAPLVPIVGTDREEEEV